MSNTKMKNKNLDDKDSSNNDATQIKGNKKNEGSKNDKPINTYDKSDLNVEKITNKLFDDLISKRDLLKKEIYSLEKKKDELNKDMQQSFSGQSDNIAKHVKGFQDYLGGALQDLSQSVERLELVKQPIVVKPSPLDQKEVKSENNEIINVPALSDTFKPDEEIIRKCFKSFESQPDFYADPWNLRRSLDSQGIEILNDWFFNMGGRGALESRGSRQKNVLIAAGLISILGELYGDQFQTLILASEPERLGEWRRLLQDSLGLSRDDFGPNSGIVLFERSEGVIERADRLEENNEVPMIIVDASETSIEIPILQFPLWLAFVGTDEEIYDSLEFD
tara:strand:- start:530 stop:1534 length:1005 start_codon:yes stop_codon:yes gene_type:complete